MKNNAQKGIAPVLIITLLAIVLIGGGFFAYKMHSSTTTNSMIPNNMHPLSPGNVSPSVMPSNTAMNPTSSLPNGDSNAQLDQDLQTIGGKVNSVNSSSTDVDTSIQNESADNATIQ